MKKTTYRLLIMFCILGIIGIFSGVSPAPTYAESPAQTPPVDQLQGILNIVYGDPQNESDEVIITIGLLDLTTKQETAKLQMGIGLAHTYMGQAVQVEVARTSGISQVGELPTYLVQEITPIAPVTPAVSSTAPNIATIQLTGSQPFINLLCKFPDVASIPYNPSDYASLFSNSYGGIDNYWRNISYNAINTIGTTTASAWVTLPRPKSYYVPVSGNPLLFSLLQDCADASDSIVNFAPFVGVNIMLNDSIGCCAWGGGPYYIDNDGGKYMRTTWNPPWAQSYQVIAHETGHALGLPHSSGPANNPPSELSIYVSQWDVMSDGGDCTQNGAWGCIPAGTIAYYLTLNDWIPAGRKVAVPTSIEGTLTLRRVRENVGSGYILATIPINNSTTRFYSVEVRDISGYDTNVPATAVLIHEINLSRTGNTGPALVVDDDMNTTGISPGLIDNDGNDNVNDFGSQWQVGETFNDFANNISVRVVSKSLSNDYVVEIKNDPGILFTENELLTYLSANATGGIDYFLVDFIANSAAIYMRVGTETVRAVVTSTNVIDGSLVRFSISTMTNEANGALLPATTDMVNTHLIANLNNALDELIATRVPNANIETIVFAEWAMGVTVAN
ncbi:MAG: hypothetical protein SFZ02_02145 [bacterium]|nr:hypothetical protein [bacterium]